MAITSFTPQTNYPRFSTVVFPTFATTPQVLSTAGGVVTMTAAQAMQGILPCDCQDAQTFNFPTAAAIVAAINGCQVGTSFQLEIINYGDSLLTMAVNTGVTKTTIATVAAVLTIATLTGKRFLFVVTNVAAGSEAVTVWTVGASAALVA
jgi:hypothetical protein